MRLRFLKSYLATNLECPLTEVMNMDEDFGVGTVILSHLMLEKSVDVKNKELYLGGEEKVEVEGEGIESSSGKRIKVEEKVPYVIDCSNDYLESREKIQWDMDRTQIEKSKERRYSGMPITIIS